MSTGTLKIHSENILPIIKKWLYSDKDIFLRELVSNACDAMSKVCILRDQNACSVEKESLKISIKVDKEKKQIIISDGGIGMSAEEVEKYIAQLAFSGAEEFVEKYKDVDEKEQIIGHFGLGFYSAFMVSSLVEIQTKSYNEETPAAFWSCDGSSEYVLQEGTRKERGTDIILHINEESQELLEESKLQEILKKHCLFLPFPIFLNDKQINEKEPLWIKPASECTEQEYLDFYRYLYPMDPDPIFWIHLNVDYPFNLKGILYFPKIGKRFDVNQPSVHLYCNRVFVSDNCKDLIPDYLTVLRGVIDSPDIPLNVSRSYLQMDKTVRQLASHISKKVSDKLSTIHKTEKETYLEKWPDIEMIVKLGVLQDEKFYDRVKEQLLWKSSSGEWTTVENYLERNKDKTSNKIYYSAHPEDHKSHMADVYAAKEIEIVYAPQYLDTPLINYLESKLNGAKFQRIDGGIDDAILDKEREKNILDSEGKTESSRIADFFRSALNRDKLQVEAKSLSSDSIPAFVMLKEETRRMRDYLAMTGNEFPGNLMEEQTLVVNTNSPLIAALPKIATKDKSLADSLAHEVYELTLLSQKELSPQEMGGFITRTTEVLEKLATHVS